MSTLKDPLKEAPGRLAGEHRETEWLVGIDWIALTKLRKNMSERISNSFFSVTRFCQYSEETFVKLGFGIDLYIIVIKSKSIANYLVPSSS